MTDLSVTLVLVLAAIGLAGGIGIAAIGPGGVLPTIGLFALTDLTPTQVAGTAIVTHVATGLFGTAVYTRSGQLRDPETRRTAAVLAGMAVVGTPLGILVNGAVSDRGFGLILGSMVAVTAALVLLREYRRPSQDAVQVTVWPLVAIGLLVSIAAGIVGIGGPMLTVPLLVAMGVGMLESLAAAQVQSVVIAAIGTIGYLSIGAVDWALVAIIGVPEMFGVLLGWRIAHALPTQHLKYAMVAGLLLLAPYLALHG